MDQLVHPPGQAHIYDIFCARDVDIIDDLAEFGGGGHGAGTGDQELIRKILYIAHDRSIEEWKTLVGDAPAARLEALYAFIAHGSAGVIENWVTTGMHESPQEVAALVAVLSMQGLQAFVKDTNRPAKPARSS